MQRAGTSGSRDMRGARISRGDFLRIGGAGLAGAALLGSGALAGCGGSGGGSEGGANSITFSWGPEETGTLQKMINRFNEENEAGITVKYREMPSDTGKYFDQIRTEFQAGGGEIDVIGHDIIWPAQFAAQGYILDLSELFPSSERSKFLEAPMQGNTFEDKPYGVPWYTDSGMLYYRKDLLEKNGINEPPQTWDELKQMAKQVQEAEGTKFGFVFQGAEYEGGVCNGLEYIWSHGGDVLDPNDPSKVVVDSPESVAALTTQRSTVADEVAPQAVSSYTEQESQTTFLNGDAVFMRNWPYIYGLAANEDESKVRQNQIGVAPLPAGPGGDSFSALGGWNLSINANSEKQEAAWTFIQYMVAPEQQKEFALKTARIPTLESLLDDQEILDEVPVIALGKEAISRTRPRPVSPYYSDISLQMAKQFNRSLSGETQPEQAVKTLDTELKSIIEQGQAQG